MRHGWMVMGLALAATLLCAACEDGGGASSADAATSAGGGGGGGGLGGAGGSGGGGVDLPPVTREAVSGQLTFAADGHLFSVEVTGNLLQRLTEAPGPWGHHAVAPDARQIAAVKTPAGGGPRSVWIIDVRTQNARRVSPPTCDAGIGGVGWLDPVRVLYAMSCGDEPSHLYVAVAASPDPTPGDLLRIDDHPEPTRDVFTAVRTPIFGYVLDREVCDGGTCVTKPEIWIAELDGQRCQLSDGDPAMISGPGARLGDHAPAFDSDLTHVVFSRNVAGKEAGAEGHFDLFRVGFSVDALLRGRERCAEGTTANLTTTLLPGDAYPIDDGSFVVGSERWPDAAAGRGPDGSILFTSEAADVRQIWVVDPGGNRTLLSPNTTHAGPARWIVDAYDLGG